MNPALFLSPFPASDGLRAVTADFAGEEVAAILDLPHASPNVDIITLVEQYVRRFCVLPAQAYLPLSVWIVATYAANAFDTFPYIALLSPMKRCGKTRVLEVLEMLCKNPWRGTCFTPAVLYRVMANCPTFLADEVEGLNRSRMSETQQTILAILNAGHRKGGLAHRCEGQSHIVKAFPVYGPKAYAAIGTLPDTLVDRSIRIEMQRKTEDQKVERFLFSRARADAAAIQAALEEWAGEHYEEVCAAYSHMQDLRFLKDRENDLWAPLFAVCATAGPDRVPELEKCAISLCDAKGLSDIDDSLPLELLTDLRDVWSGNDQHMSSTEAVNRLIGQEDGHWRDEKLSPHKLAKLLRPFDVKPRQVRQGAVTFKGYLRSELDAALIRYAP